MGTLPKILTVWTLKELVAVTKEWNLNKEAPLFSLHY